MSVQLDPCLVPSECTDVVRTIHSTSTQRTLTCHYCISDKRPVGGRYCLKSYIWPFHVFHVFLLVGRLGRNVPAFTFPSFFVSLTCHLLFVGYLVPWLCLQMGLYREWRLVYNAPFLFLFWMCVESSYCPLSGSCCLCLTSVWVGESWRNPFFSFPFFSGRMG